MCRAQTQTVSNRTGVNQPRQHPTTRSISALIGERANRRCTRAVGRAVPLVLPSAAKGRASDATGPSDAQRSPVLVSPLAKWTF